MTVILMMLYHGCLRWDEAVVSECNLKDVLKRSHVEIVKVGGIGHDVVLRMHAFKHNKS